MKKWQIQNSETSEISEILFRVFLFPSFRFCPRAKIENSDLKISEENFRDFRGFRVFDLALSGVYKRGATFLQILTHFSNTPHNNFKKYIEKYVKNIFDGKYYPPYFRHSDFFLLSQCLAEKIVSCSWKYKYA